MTGAASDPSARPRSRVRFAFASEVGGELAVPARVVVGDGCVARLGEALRGLVPVGGPVLVVVDAALVELGLAERATAPLEAAGFEPQLAPQAAGEPDLAAAGAVAAAARARDYVAVVGLGGGSALDPAKLAAGLATNGGEVEEYLAGRRIERAPLTLACVPTTAGTGAEASRNTIVTHEGRKYVIGSPLLTPPLALLDPLLTLSCPPAVTAASGLDALAHAVEAVLSLNANPLTSLDALAAVRALSEHLRRAHADGSDLEARRALLYAAHLAGLAINAVTVLGHSMAYTIAARTHLPHGVTTAMALPYCVAYCAPGAAERIAALELEAGADVPLARWLRRLAGDLGIPASLGEVGIAEDELPAMATECMERYPRPHNPVPFERGRLELLYRLFHAGDLDGALEALE